MRYGVVVNDVGLKFPSKVRRRRGEGEREDWTPVNFVMKQLR